MTLFSVLFRLSTYFYLRVIPIHRWARFIIPGFYFGYLIAVFWDVAPEPTVVVIPEKVEVIDIIDSETNKLVEEDVVVTGTAVVAEPTLNGYARPPQAIPSSGNSTIDFLGSLLLGFPSKSRLLNMAGVVINTLLLLSAADFAYTPLIKSYNPTFTRVGAIDDSSVKILVRYPDLQEGQLRIVWQRVHALNTHADIWKDGPVLDIEEEKDWTAIGKISNLWPSAEYVYRLANLNSTFLPYPEKPVSFKTFPDPRSSSGTRFKFIVGSCMLPNFPYNPAFPERIKGLDIISDWIDSFNPKPVNSPSTTTAPASPVEEAESIIAEASAAIASATNTPISELPIVKSILDDAKPREIGPEFMLMIGDNIYADVPYSTGGDLEAFRKLYRRTFSSSSFRKVYERLPIFGIYDDHEFKNNFAGENDENKPPFANASSAFGTYYGDANFDGISDVNYYDFRYGDNAFFVLDTRRYRSVPASDPESMDLPTMLGERQLHALHTWLARVNTTTTFKFIISSVPMTSLWHGYDGQSDSWAAYRIERDSLLDVLQYVPNVFVLSGDRHEFAFVEHRGKIPEISVSPISMFALNSMTLHSKSIRTIEKTYLDTIYDVNGASLEVTVTESIPEERAIHYIPSGNYKFASLEVDTRNWKRPTLKLEAIIGGKTAYRFEFIGQPVAHSYTSSLALSFGGALKGVLNKIGLMRSVF
ncbi:hypothetical protein FRB91_007085 [Serendipita sp. 411]|nr:hypothetical protein FRC18_010093 [Serendipita sp. 400]KAG8859661.1 hypothetical protein FRB91_007085 [Serendipita sp. 411]